MLRSHSFYHLVYQFHEHELLTFANWFCTGRFITFSVITNIYNRKTKRRTLMELFTATGKLKKFFFYTRIALRQKCELRCETTYWGGFYYSFYLYRFRKYVSYGFPIINVCNAGVHYKTPCIIRHPCKCVHVTVFTLYFSLFDASLQWSLLTSLSPQHSGKCYTVCCFRLQDGWVNEFVCACTQRCLCS
jgi:hypothetical protein